MSETKPIWRTKYHNAPCVFDGYRFDSQAEARRYQQLRLRQNACEIFGLLVHPRYELQPVFRRDGKTYRAVTYEGDFEYMEAGGQKVCEDVKGIETTVWRLKMRLFLQRYPDIDLRVIPAWAT